MYKFKVMGKFSNRVIIQTNEVDQYKLTILVMEHASEYLIQIDEGHFLMDFYHLFENTVPSVVKVKTFLIDKI